MLHALLRDRGARGRKIRRFLNAVRRNFLDPRNRGKCIGWKNIALKYGLPSKDEELAAAVYQEWLRVNEDAPLAIRQRIKYRLETKLDALDPDYRWVFKTALEDWERVAYVPREVAKEWLTEIAAPLSDQFVRCYRLARRTVMVRATPIEEAISLVRDAYVTARVGSMPDVTKILTDHGYIDADGNPTPKVPGLTEKGVRERQLAEDWRSLRATHINRVFDIIPEEVRLVAIARAVKAHEILFQQAQVVSHLFTTYYSTGKMGALKDPATQLAIRPDPTIIASLFESMRRMLGDTGDKISVTLQQTIASQHAQGVGAKADVQISLTSREWLANMEKMSLKEIEGEIKEIERMRVLLVGADSPPPVAVPEISVVDAESGGQPPADPV